MSRHLNKKALIAHEYLKWIERLHLRQLVGCQEVLTKGRHTEINNQVLNRAVTKSALLIYSHRSNLNILALRRILSTLIFRSH